MGRRAKIRTSYQGDSAYLGRMAEAVELDPRAESDWKREVIKRCNALARLLAEETERRFS